MAPDVGAGTLLDSVGLMDMSNEGRRNRHPGARQNLGTLMARLL